MDKIKRSMDRQLRDYIVTTMVNNTTEEHYVYRIDMIGLHINPNIILERAGFLKKIFLYGHFHRCVNKLYSLTSEEFFVVWKSYKRKIMPDARELIHEIRYSKSKGGDYFRAHDKRYRGGELSTGYEYGCHTNNSVHRKTVQ